MNPQGDSVEDQIPSSIKSSASSPPEPEQVAQDGSREGKTLSKSTSEPAYPPTRKVLAIMASLILALFLTSLDRLIIPVAIPHITDDFHSLGDVGWYASAYLLTSCAFQLFMGRVYTFYDPKWVFLCSLGIFEVGSAVCGGAPNSNALIIGRAVAGLGNAGLFQGALVILVYTLPLHKRPQYTGFLGMTLGVSSSLGPLLGGAFTDGPGWRWCFLINLPCGAVTIFVLIFLLRIESESLQRKSTTWKEKFYQLDPVGTLFFLPCVICLLLALQWGGLVYSWSSARIIVLLIMSGLLFIAFLIVQRWKGDTATVAGRIFFNRSIMAGTWFAFFNFGATITLFYYITIWFQAIKGVSAVKSGIMTLPTVLGMVIASAMGGILTKKIGYYAPWMILGSILTPIGAGFISTFTPATGHAGWIGFQALFGLGAGIGMQQPSVAAQTVLARIDVGTGASLVMFSQLLGGTVWTSVGNNLLDLHLAKYLAKIPGLDIGAIVKTGATDLRSAIPSDKLPQALAAYNDALRTTFYLVVALSCATSIGAAAMEWKSVKKEKQQPSKDAGAEKGEDRVEPKEKV